MASGKPGGVLGGGGGFLGEEGVFRRVGVPAGGGSVLGDGEGGAVKEGGLGLRIVDGLILSMF